MACEYEIAGVKNSLNFGEVIKYYYKSTGLLANTNIFSSEEIVASVYSRIQKQLDKQNLKQEVSDDKEVLSKGKGKVAVLDYITSQNNTDVYKKIGLDKDRLVPEYNKDNYILNETKRRIRQDGFPAPEKDSLKDILEKYPQASKYVSEIEEEIFIGEQTKNLSLGIHNILARIFREEGEVSDYTRGMLRKLIIDNQDYLHGDIDLWVDKFISIFDNLYEKITAKGERVLTEVVLESEEAALAQVRGKIDILTIDSSGRTHIYDIKLSKDLYEDWSSERILQTDYQLAFYRALLGQYVKTDDATLNIIPIRLGGLNADKKIDVNNLVLDKIVDRLSQEGGKGLLVTGRIYKTARLLIPSTTELFYDPEKIEEVKSDLSLIFKDYNIKTSGSDYDVETLLDKAVKQQGITMFLEGFEDPRAHIRNNRLFIDHKVGDRYKTEEELRIEYRPIIEKYVAFAKMSENNNVSQLMQKIISSIDKNGETIQMMNPRDQIIVNNIAHQYINGDYDVVRGSDELVSLGIILLRNKKYGSYVLLNISSHNQKANYDNKWLYRDVDFIKAMVFLNRYHKDLDLDFNKVQDIITYNPLGNQIFYKHLESGFREFDVLMKEHGLTLNLKNSHILPAEKKASIEIREAQRYISNKLSEGDKASLKSILDKYSEQIEDLTVERLKNMVKDFIKAFPNLEKKSFESGFDFNNHIEYLFGMINTLLLIKAEQIPMGDYTGLNNFNINFSSIYDIFSGFFKNTREYDAKEKRILSFMDGLKMATPDRIGSKDLQNINIMLSGTNSFIRQSFYKQSTIISGLTRKYYDSINYTNWEQNWVGDHRTKFQNMWFKTSNGNISMEWRTKNPYSDSLEDSMTESEKEYLKGILFEMNKRKLNIPKSELDKANITTLESMEKTMPSTYQKIVKMIADKTYFKMPLVRSQQIGRHTSVIRKGYAHAVDVYKQEMYNSIDSRELESDEIRSLKERLGYYEMYNIYDRQTDKFKEKAIETKGIDYFELDLDAISHRLTFNQIRKAHLDNILPVINAYTWWMKVQSGKAGEDISKELEHVKNRIKLAAADESIIDPEAEDVVQAASVVKKITTAGMLAFRPALFLKEMTIGLYKGSMLAFTKIYGGEEQFTISDLGKALGKLATIDKKFAREWNMIDGINNEYGFANRDVNSLAPRLQSNRRGLHMGLGPWMYTMNTVPDYYNRLALLLAKMIHDGSYDAHGLDKDGYLTYDPKKDKRFSYYFEVRDKYKAEEGSVVKYKSSSTDKLYNKQKSLYNLLTDQLNSERIRMGYEKFSEGDIVDKAYSELERSSYKSFVDGVYGYYDVDSQSEIHKTWYGILYLQFLQFWPGKMNMWFASSKKKGVTPTGRFEQMSKEIDGKKVLLWRREVIDEETGKITGFEITEEDTGDPAYEWVGTPQEGLAIALMMTAKDIVTFNWSNIKSDDLRTRRALYGLSDGLLMLIFFAIISNLLKAYREENGDDGIDGETIRFIDAVNDKILNEANILDNTFGALRSKPAFWTYSTRVAGNVIDVIEGDRTAKQALAKNIRAFEFLEE